MTGQVIALRILLPFSFEVFWGGVDVPVHNACGKTCPQMEKASKLGVILDKALKLFSQVQ